MIRIALALVLALSMAIPAALAEQVVSDTFTLTDEVTIKVEAPAEEQPVEEQPAEEQPVEEGPAEEPAEEQPTAEPLPTEPPLPTQEPLPTEPPIPTVEPLPTDEALSTEQPLPTDELPTATPTPTQEAPAPQRSVSISIDKPLDAIYIGDEVTFTATLHGYEGAQVEIFWECMTNGEWQPTGDTGATLTVVIDESNAQSSWRCGVTVLAEPELEQPVAE